MGTRGTALHAAVESGGEQIVELLVQHGANVNAVGTHRESPLLIAAAMGMSRIVERLLSLKADASLKDIAGKSPLDMAKEGKHADIVAMLKTAVAKH